MAAWRCSLRSFKRELAEDVKQQKASSSCSFGICWSLHSHGGHGCSKLITRYGYQDRTISAQHRARLVGSLCSGAPHDPGWHFLRAATQVLLPLPHSPPSFIGTRPTSWSDNSPHRILFPLFLIFQRHFLWKNLTLLIPSWHAPSRGPELTWSPLIILKLAAKISEQRWEDHFLGLGILLFSVVPPPQWSWDLEWAQPECFA